MVPKETHRTHRRIRIRVVGRSETPCCDHQKPFRDRCGAAELSGSKDLGKSDPEAFFELEDGEATLHQQDTGIGMYASSGRFDMQVCVMKRLSEMMTKPRKVGNLRLATPARHLVGTQKFTLRFDHQEFSDIVRIPVDSDWAGSEERYSTQERLEFHGGHLVDS